MHEYTVIDILKSKLKELGCDGLAADECGCGIDDLIPCMGDCSRCVPAKSRIENGEIVWRPVQIQKKETP